MKVSSGNGNWYRPMTAMPMVAIFYGQILHPIIQSTLNFLQMGSSMKIIVLAALPKYVQALTAFWPIAHLKKKSNCNTETEKLKISEQSETILILNYHVIEGVIKEKYIPVN